VRLLAVAAPGYLDARGRPSHPAELRDHDALGYSGATTPGAWRFTHPQFGEEVVEPIMRLWADNADLLAPALAAGAGIAVQPEFLVWRDLRAGTLEQVIPDWTYPPLALHLVMPPSPLRSLRVQVVIDRLAAALAAAPWSDA